MNTGCVIGIGCDDHGDQIAGLLVAREVRRRTQPAMGIAGTRAVTVVESSGAPDELVRAWRGAGTVVVVEAMPGERPGTIHRCRPHPREAGFGCSTTQLSSRLREALALEPLPECLYVVTIEGTCFVQHAPATPAVAQAAADVADGLMGDLSVTVPALTVEIAPDSGTAPGQAATRRGARVAEPAPYGIAVVRGHRRQRPQPVPAVPAAPAERIVRPSIGRR